MTVTKIEKLPHLQSREYGQHLGVDLEEGSRGSEPAFEQIQPVTV
jgi:hypothetical protein